MDLVLTMPLVANVKVLRVAEYHRKITIHSGKNSFDLKWVFGAKFLLIEATVNSLHKRNIPSHFDYCSAIK